MLLLKQILRRPIFEGDEEKTHVAGMLNTILMPLTLGIVVLIIFAFIGGLARPAVIASESAFLLVLIGLRFLLWRG
jgi:hypothetical protein